MMPDKKYNCGWPVGDSIHFLLKCSLYIEQCQVYINTLPDAGEDKNTVILFGSSILDTNSNITKLKQKTQFVSVK